MGVINWDSVYDAFMGILQLYYSGSTCVADVPARLKHVNRAI